MDNQNNVQRNGQRPVNNGRPMNQGQVRKPVNNNVRNSAPIRNNQGQSTGQGPSNGQRPNGSRQVQNNGQRPVNQGQRVNNRPNQNQVRRPAQNKPQPQKNDFGFTSDFESDDFSSNDFSSNGFSSDFESNDFGSNDFGSDDFDNQVDDSSSFEDDFGFEGTPNMENRRMNNQMNGNQNQMNMNQMNGNQAGYNEPKIDAKVTAVIGYLTLIGFIVVMVIGDKENAKPWLNQALTLHIANAVLTMVSIFIGLPWFLSCIIGVANILVGVCYIVGIVGAIQERVINLPLIDNIQLLK